MGSSITISLVSLSILALLGILWVMRGVVDALRTGPTRFRLPLASMATASQGGKACALVFLVCAFLMLPLAFKSRTLSSLVTPIVFSWAALSNFQSFAPRRHRRRWVVLASGLIGLAIGVVGLAVGLALTSVGIDSLFPGLPRPLVLMLVVCFMAVSTEQMREALFGTRVREHSIEIFGRTYPASRIIFKGWRECEEGFVLCLSISSRRLFGMSSRSDVLLTIPVRASDRPALEAFFAGHAATAEGPHQ
jgi:hypothetical protein